MRYTFKQFKAEYPDDAACLAAIMESRYGGTEFTCPACKVKSKFHMMSKRRAYACQNCGHHIYPCAGTVFEKSRTKLTDWFFAMYLMTSTRHGVAAKELQRQLGVTYKTAWRMAHELRKLMAQADEHGPLSGHVEIDEAYVGGRRRGQKRKGVTGRGAGKAVVFGMAERGGPLRAGPVPNASRKTTHQIITRNIQRGSLISTDEWPAYANLKRIGYQHGRVRHAAKEYVRGIHHVNNLENFWAQLKRGIKGTNIHVSKKHLWKYVSEYAFRYNMRKEPEAMLSSLIDALSTPRLQDS